MACIVESTLKHPVGRSRKIQVEIRLWGWGRIPPGLGGYSVNSVRRVVFVGLLGDVITRHMPFFADRMIDLDARQILIFVVRLQIWVVVVERISCGTRRSRYIRKDGLSHRIP